MAITLRSGTKLGEPKVSERQFAQVEFPLNKEIEEVQEGEKQEKKGYELGVKKDNEQRHEKKVEICPYMPPKPPYHSAIPTDIENKGLLNFIEKLKRLHMKLPLPDTFRQMPKCAKFL